VWKIEKVVKSLCFKTFQFRKGLTPEMESAISENLVREYNSLDNSEETLTKGSVETIRTQSEMTKI